MTLASDTGSSNNDKITSNGVVNVTGLEDGATWQYSVNGGAWTNGSGASIAATVFHEGVNTVQVKQTDKAGNVSSEGSLTFTLDTLPPTAVITSNYSTLNTGGTTTLTFTFSEDCTDFVFDDITVTGGTLSNFSGSGKVYTAVFTATATGTTTANITVTGGAYHDAAGNNGGGANLQINIVPVSPVYLTRIAAGTDGFVLNGQGASDLSGYRLSGVGDVNGDGLSDMILSAPGADPTSTRTDAGRSYVIFGKTDASAIELSAVASGVGGFAINGAAANDQSGQSISGAGDVNGDGLADLIIGAPYSGSNAGKSYVVFGKTSTTVVTLSSLASSSGFEITGASASDQSGWSVSGAGDVNGDGLADLIVGANKADPTTGTDGGKSYVLFGKTGAASAINLSAIATGGGFVINGQVASDGSGYSVASAGTSTATATATCWLAPTTAPARLARRTSFSAAVPWATLLVLARWPPARADLCLMAKVTAT